MSFTTNQEPCRAGPTLGGRKTNRPPANAEAPGPENVYVRDMDLGAGEAGAFTSPQPRRVRRTAHLRASRDRIRLDRGRGLRDQRRRPARSRSSLPPSRTSPGREPPPYRSPCAGSRVGKRFSSAADYDPISRADDAQPRSRPAVAAPPTETRYAFPARAPEYSRWIEARPPGAAISADGTTVTWMGVNVGLQARVLPGEAPLPEYTEPLWRRIADPATADRARHRRRRTRQPRLRGLRRDLAARRIPRSPTPVSGSVPDPSRGIGTGRRRQRHLERPRGGEIDCRPVRAASERRRIHGRIPVPGGADRRRRILRPATRKRRAGGHLRRRHAPRPHARRSADQSSRASVPRRKPNRRRSANSHCPPMAVTWRSRRGVPSSVSRSQRSSAPSGRGTRPRRTVLRRPRKRHPDARHTAASAAKRANSPTGASHSEPKTSTRTADGGCHLAVLRRRRLRCWRSPRPPSNLVAIRRQRARRHFSAIAGPHDGSDVFLVARETPSPLPTGAVHMPRRRPASTRQPVWTARCDREQSARRECGRSMSVSPGRAS